MPTVRLPGNRPLHFFFDFYPAAILSFDSPPCLLCRHLINALTLTKTPNVYCLSSKCETVPGTCLTTDTFDGPRGRRMLVTSMSLGQVGESPCLPPTCMPDVCMMADSGLCVHTAYFARLTDMPACSGAHDQYGVEALRLCCCTTVTSSQSQQHQGRLYTLWQGKLASCSSASSQGHQPPGSHSPALLLQLLTRVLTDAPGGCHQPLQAEDAGHLSAP